MLILGWFTVCIIFAFVELILSGSGHALEVFALLSGGIWLNERLTFIQWVGVGFVLISVFFVSQRKLIWELNNTE